MFFKNSQDGLEWFSMDNSLQFDGWLKGIVRRFSSLSSDEKTETLNELLSICNSEQLWSLHQKLPDFLYRDFILLLPPEITEKILRYLSPSCLLSAIGVSKGWNLKISGMNQLWKEQCNIVGCNLNASLDIDYRASCVQGLRLRHELQEGRVWDQEGLVNLVKPPGRFSALHHHLGHIAGGTADSSHTTAVEDSGESIVIWSVSANRVDVSFPVSGSVSCIKLLYPVMVVCGHFDGTLSSHKVCGMASSYKPPLRGFHRFSEPGSLLKKFRLHTSPVLSLDFDMDENILVSGSADCTTKIWELSSGALLKTLASQSHWVLSVIFASYSIHSIPAFRDRQVLIIMTRDDIQLFSWDPERKCVRGPTDQNECQNIVNLKEVKQKQTLKEIENHDLYIPLKSVTDAIQSFFFTPGLHFDGRRISFVRQMPMFDTQTIGDADIVTIDTETGKVVQSVHVNQKIRKLLAIGKRFAVILLPFVDSKYKNLAVVDLLNREIIGGCTVPHSRASTPDFSQVSIGDTAWLDGFTESSTSGLVASLALADSSIQTVIWRQHNSQKSEDDSNQSWDLPHRV
ncbi:F-box/WD repeat-containing protein 2 [Eurytemora carolleeae]|uniref:F-box/WD repeat-containing protein 2 n=1 Tax=Eurytemora carolleeae TaxID=1294199 RepID=UPI000C77BC76|nr:F-box/WD repeat-containing protein 2 [Eurytemora carolleeae]|eukprot:XP_023331984.1 F-box/WD repeat-containing protein 2-like [Eurytemora affinis]